MSFSENLGNRILELLNFPVVQRCPELGIIFDRCSLRELQEIFPALVNSMFMQSSGLGWGLRTISKENCPEVFDVLYNFFSPLGPIFRLCYRLLNDAIKFEFSVELLPHKLTEMLQSGHYSMFYADLLNVDPFSRCITSLSLNAFDYFILNFIIHGTYSLHKIYPAALHVHNDRVKTAYFYLAADYLCMFLPANPDAVVMPTNICGTVKAPQPMPVQQLQPTRTPKYLKLSAISHYTATANLPSTSTSRAPESPRAHCWRSESVLHLTLDTWLRYDVNETMELPSSEFIRVVRILVKQLHAFGNSAELDQSSMSVLRKLAQPMMKTRIYPFLRSIISRWPLDSSLTVVLELWLSYIQPWRYTFDRQLNNLTSPNEIQVNSRYEGFIAENLGVYTQIFVQILPRFERLDFTSFRNVVMLHRFAKVFSQSNLAEVLCDCELRYSNSQFPPIGSATQSPIRQPQYYSHQRANATGEWDSLRNLSGGEQHFLGDCSNTDVYVPMFGPIIKTQIQSLIKTISVAKLYVQQEMNQTNHAITNKSKGLNIIKRLFVNFFEDVTPEQLKLIELRKIPDILDLARQSMCNMFTIEIPDLTLEHNVELKDFTYNQVSFSSTCGDSDYFDISRIHPIQMKNNVANLRSSVDPALLPIQLDENKFLVRFLHQISCKVNEMFSQEIQMIWSRNDIWGKLSRQILYPPMTVQWFDKSKGISELCEEQLGPRVCLRILASYKTIILILFWLIFLKVFWSISSISGIFLLIIIYFGYLFILALIQK